MAKDPAFLFYPNDFTSGTRFMSDEQVGKFIRLLCAQFDLGHLDEKHMIMICGSYDNDIFSKFKKDSQGKFYNQRLEDEKVKRSNFCESRGKNRRSKNNISNSYDSHMENENENVIDSVSNTNTINADFQKNETRKEDYSKNSESNSKTEKAETVTQDQTVKPIHISNAERFRQSITDQQLVFKFAKGINKLNCIMDLDKHIDIHDSGLALSKPGADYKTWVQYFRYYFENLKVTGKNTTIAETEYTPPYLTKKLNGER